MMVEGTVENLVARTVAGSADLMAVLKADMSVVSLADMSGEVWVEQMVEWKVAK